MSPFILLCVTGFLAIFSSTISKSPVLPLFAAHLGAGPSEVGMVAPVSAFTGIIASIPAGMLSDRWGRKRMLMISSLVFATAPFLYVFVSNMWQLAVVRFYHGSWVFTNHYYTRHARESASISNTKLFDRDDLTSLIDSFTVAKVEFQEKYEICRYYH